MLFDPGMRAGAIALLSLALSTTFAVVQGNGRDKRDDDADRWHEGDGRDRNHDRPSA